jgi:hypothetical protein
VNDEGEERIAVDIGKIVRRIEVDPAASPELPAGPGDEPVEPSPRPSAPREPVAPGR